MRLRVSAALGIAAIGLLIGPGAASAGPPGFGNWPAGNYARASVPGDCTAPIRAPIQIALVGFASAAQAKARIGDETEWTSLDPGNDLLSMKDGGATGDPTQCVGETHGRVSPQTSDGQYRTHMSLWNNATSAVVAGAPVRQKKTTSACGAQPGSPKWITTAEGYVQGLQSFENAFTGSPATVGPYPTESVNWGNSASIQQCSGAVVAGDGFVDVIRPKDEFGFQDSFGESRDALFRAAPLNDDTVAVGDCDDEEELRDEHYGAIKQSVIDQLQGAGVTTMRFGINWSTVAPCSASTPGQWYWERWDKTIPQLAAAGIKPIVIVSSAPANDPGDPQWSEPGCGGVVNTDPNSGGLANWRQFVKQVATKYEGKIKAIEVWNEENDDHSWGDCPADPEAYAKILHSALLGVADSGTNVKVILGGPVSNIQDPLVDMPWDDYLTQVFEDLSPADEAALDAVGFHPYRRLFERNTGVHPADSARTQITAVRAELPADLPVWVTEVGTSIVDSQEENVPIFVGTNPWAQGFADRAIYDTLRNMGVPTTIVYSYANNDLNAPGTGAGVLGRPNPETLDVPFPTKPAYCLLLAERGEAPPSPCPSS